MKLIVAYVRVSTAKQLDGQGPAQQRAAIAAYAAATGVKIDEWHEEDETGTLEDREIIQSLLARSAAGEIGKIIIDRLDRLGRRQMVCERLYEAFTSQHTELVFASVSLDRSPTGTLVRQIMGAIAEYQRSEWLARMRSCKRSAVAKAGRSGGGNVPYGYTAVGRGNFIVDGDTCRLVSRAFELADKGVTPSGIARALSAEGMRTKKGTAISATQVHRILARRDFYAGTRVLHTTLAAPDTVPIHPPLI